MSNITASRLGLKSGGSDNKQLFLELFGNEVLTVFDSETEARNRIRKKTLTSGKSYRFPSIARTNSGYHVPGTQLTGRTIAHDEIEIGLDGRLYTDTLIDDLDEVLNHYDVRTEYSKRMGQALAQTYDRNLLSLGVKACRNPTVANLGKGLAGFGSAESIAIGTTPTTAQYVAALKLAAQKFAEKNIPVTERVAFMPWEVFYTILEDTKLINRDYSAAGGDYNKAMMQAAFGFELVPTNNLAVDHTDAGVLAQYPDVSGGKYAVDASDTAILCVWKNSLCTVQAMDLTTKVEYMIQYLGHMMVSYLAVGHGVLRPEGLIELRKVAP